MSENKKEIKRKKGAKNKSHARNKQDNKLSENKEIINNIKIIKNENNESDMEILEDKYWQEPIKNIYNLDSKIDINHIIKK